MTMKSLFSLLSIVLIASAALVAQDQTAAITAYNEARELAQGKDYSAAIDKYTEAIEIASQLGEEGEDIKNRSEKQIPKLYFTIAVDAFNEFRGGPSLEKLDAAIAIFIQSEEIGVSSGDTDVQRKSTSVLAQLNYQKGLMLFKREMFVESEVALDEAIRINPNYAKAYYQKALVHKKNNPEDVDGIMSWYDQAIATAIRVNDTEVERLANQTAHGDLLFRGGRVVLPQPLAPSRQPIPPAGTRNETESTINLPPRCTLTLSSCSAGDVIDSRPRVQRLEAERTTPRLRAAVFD